MNNSQQLIPSAPKRVPLLGHIPWLLHNSMEFLDSTRAQGDIVKIYFGTRPSYLIHSPELIRRVLVTDANKFDRGRMFQKARLFVGNGLVTTDGAFHRKQRRIMQPAFHRERIAGYVDVMRNEITKLMSLWSSGQRISFDKEMIELTLTVSAKALFSADIASHAVKEVRDQLPIVVKGILSETISPDFWSKFPTPAHRRFTAALVRLRTVVNDIIVAYQREGVDHGDLLSMLVAARYEDTGEPMSTQQLRDEVITSLFAATETTAASLSWAFHVMGERPDIEERLCAEIGTVLAGRPVSSADLADLEYTRRFIKETLRRHSPVWFVLRRTIVPVELGGKKIPENSQVLYSPASVHRDPTLYSDPLVFDPDRWLPERAQNIPRSAFIPFSVGNHQCIGESFAWTEMMVAVTTILARWRVVPAPGYHVKEAMLATLRPSALPMTTYLR